MSKLRHVSLPGAAFIIENMEESEMSGDAGLKENMFTSPVQDMRRSFSFDSETENRVSSRKETFRLKRVFLYD